MSRKQKKKDAREQSTRQLMGIDDITDYGIATRMGELVFFAIKPTNISVLPDTGVGARIYALLNVVKGMAEIEMLALNSKESFENNKAFYRQRANEEELPVIRKLLEQDSKHLDRIQVLMASSREFYILVRLQGKKESDVFSYLSRIEKSIKDNGFTVLFEHIEREQQEYTDSLYRMTQGQLIANAGEIEATRFCYNALLTAVFEREQLILLLSNDKPLTSVREAWQAERIENYDMEFSHTILRFCEDIRQAQQPEMTM